MPYFTARSLKVRAFPLKYLFTYVYPIYDPSKHRFLRDIPRHVHLFNIQRDVWPRNEPVKP